MQWKMKRVPVVNVCRIHQKGKLMGAMPTGCFRQAQAYPNEEEYGQKIPPPLGSRAAFLILKRPVTTITYLWGKHFNQLIQKPEFCHFTVKSVTTVVHTGLQHLQKTKCYQQELKTQGLGSFQNLCHYNTKSKNLLALHS